MKFKENIDKLGVFGLLLIIVFSPCCFPLFAFVTSVFGLGSFELFGGWTMWILLGMVLVSIAGFYVSYRKHHRLYPLLIAIFGGILIYYGYFLIEDTSWTYFLYVGMIGLLIATIWNFKATKFKNQIVLESVITCPNCSFKKAEIMPMDSCVYFYDCENCKQVLKPNKGDCCVYCSFGSVSCPPIQAGENCC